MIRTKKCTFLSVARLFAVVFLLLASPALRAAGDGAWAIHDMAALADPSGTETIESVSQPGRAGQFTPVSGGFSAGFTRTVHWLRFTLQAPAPDAKGQRETLLEIHPPYLDSLQIYLSQPQADGTFELKRGGDLQPHTAKEYPYRAFVFRIGFDDDRPRTAYVRLQTTSSSVLAVKAWEPSRFLEQTAREYTLLGLLLGVFVAALVANIWQGLWLREAIYRRYIAYLLATLANAVGVNGLVGEFLLPQSAFWVDHWVPLGVMSTIIFGTRFYMLALDIDHAPAWIRWSYRVQLWGAMACLPAPFLDLYPEAAKVALPSVSLTLMTGTWRSAQLWRQRDSNGKMLLLAHILSLVGTLSVIPTLFGLLPGQLWLIYGYQLGPIGTLLALQLMLTKRVQTMQNKLNQVTLDAEVAKTTAVHERAERDHQRHFLSMLTHELKTPLSVIRMRLGASAPTLRMETYAKQAVNDIDAIVERCALVSQIEEKADPLQLLPCCVDQLLAEILAQQPEQYRITRQIAQDAVAVTVQSESLLLRTVVSNLIDNAVKYSPPDSTVHIHVALGAQGGRNGVFMQIENSVAAAGVPDPARVFDKYYRTPGAYQQSGSGLGLYIVKALMEQLGGTIDCQPQAAVVIFVLWLPL